MKSKEAICSCNNVGSGDQDSSKKVVDEEPEIKKELEKARNLIRLQRVRYQQLVSLFQTRLQEKEEETRAELHAKHTQLTRILLSLYILEAKLRKEQRTLKHTLTERDNLIRNQELEITKLKSELQRQTSKCVCSDASNTFLLEESNNKPDLISSIGIEVLKSDDASLSSLQSDTDMNTYVISSLDDYNPSWSTLHVQGISPNPGSYAFETTQNVSNENICNHKIDDELQNETRKFKMKDEQTPCMILKEVTENLTEKLNGPVLNCVKQILSQDNNETPKKENENSVRCYPIKPPKPVLKRDCSKYETNVPKAFLGNNTLNVKLLPNIKPTNSKRKAEKPVQDESTIVQTVSALLSDSGESEDDEQKQKSLPTVSQMVKKFEELKSTKKVETKQMPTVAQPLYSKSDSTVIQTNFEEFHLVDKEIDSTCDDITKDKVIRLEAEGKAATSESSMEFMSTISTLGEPLINNNAKYEAFLEMTGLSQKSILTSSRILSNHRSVIKPKDVKYRSRVKAAAGLIDKCNSNANSNTSPTMKYWVEPYL